MKPNTTNELEQILDKHLHEIKAGHDGKLKTAIEHLISKRELDLMTNHLSDLSRAVGILDGLGHPDVYLNGQREKLLSRLNSKRGK